MHHSYVLGITPVSDLIIQVLWDEGTYVTLPSTTAGLQTVMGG